MLHEFYAGGIDGVTPRLGPFSFFGVFDGHDGREAATYAKWHVHKHVASFLAQNMDPIHAVAHSYVKTDVEYIRSGGRAGTTASTVMQLVVLLTDLI